MNKSEIKIYKTKKGETSIDVKLVNETVWLNLNQISTLFERDKSVISRHINNLFREQELSKDSVVAKYATTATDGKTYNVDFFNLDVIISVGYRVKSKRGTEFRIWANSILKNYLIRGYAINQEKLKKQAQQLTELKQTLKIIEKTLYYKELSNDESKGLLKIISNYSYALGILDSYDYQTLKIENISKKETYRLSYDQAIKQIEFVKKTYGNGGLFGHQKDNSFRSSIATIYQTFDGTDLYPSVEEKAANHLINKNN